MIIAGTYVYSNGDAARSPAGGSGRGPRTFVVSRDDDAGDRIGRIIRPYRTGEARAYARTPAGCYCCSRRTGTGTQRHVMTRAPPPTTWSPARPRRGTVVSPCATAPGFPRAPTCPVLQPHGRAREAPPSRFCHRASDPIRPGRRWLYYGGCRAWWPPRADW